MFQEALKLGEKNNAPDNPTVHYHLGLAYEKTNQHPFSRGKTSNGLLQL
jgi:hypothetical protein